MIYAYILILIGLLGVVVNIVQLILSCRDKNQRISAFGVALLSLNIADFLAAMILFIEGALLYIHAVMKINFPLTHWIEVAIAALVFLYTSSFTHVVWIAIQRLVAVVFPLRVKQIFLISRCYVMLVSIWVISVVPAFVSQINIKLAASLLVFIAITTGISLIVFYSVICFKTMNRNIANDAGGVLQKRRQKSEREVLLYSLAITAVFIICNFPVSITILLELPLNSFTIACDILYCLSPFLNSLLYFAWSYNKRRRRTIVHDIPLSANVQVRANVNVMGADSGP